MSRLPRINPEYPTPTLAELHRRLFTIWEDWWRTCGAPLDEPEEGAEDDEAVWLDIRLVVMGPDRRLASRWTIFTGDPSFDPVHGDVSEDIQVSGLRRPTQQAALAMARDWLHATRLQVPEMER